MLTSDCLQSEKEDTMLAWEEREEQCMVSTIVDGIDNGAVEDVFVYRASYSLFRLIQSLGVRVQGYQDFINCNDQCYRKLLYPERYNSAMDYRAKRVDTHSSSDATDRRPDSAHQP